VPLRGLFDDIAELVARDASLGIEVKVDVPAELEALGNPDQLSPGVLESGC